MSFARHVLAVNDDFPIRTQRPVHSGKVRAVYWLTPADSARLIAEKGYDVAPDTPLAVMIISDRLSAFDCIWHGEEQLMGVPGKGAALNAIAAHWFSLFKQHGLANSHILDIPHPLVWIVQQAQPIKIEAICRQYITGSMWRAYQQGEREFCGLRLPDNLEQDQKLENILLTPSTKGILTGLEGVPEADDVNVSRAQIEQHTQAFGFKAQADIDKYEKLLTEGFALIANELNKIDHILVDTKFEFGYVNNKQGQAELIYMDEVGTPDSSRMWDKTAYSQGKVVENSKEGFRQFLLNFVADADVLLNKDRMAEREQLAANTALPTKAFLYLSDIYITMAQKITGLEIEINQNPRQDIIDILAEQYGLIAAD